MNYLSLSPNLKILLQVCQDMQIPFTIKDDFGNFIEVKINNQSFYFIYCNTPFNNDATRYICKDKEFSYRVFGKDLNMPKTKGYLDPNVDEKYNAFKKQKDIKEIVVDIEKNFEYPIVIKMNSGARGTNIFFCQDAEKVEHALETIFNMKDKNYDFIANVQDFIKIKKEYRVIYFKGEILFVYEKISEKKVSISPLHNEDGKAVLIKDENLINQMNLFLEKSESLKDFEYAGLDVVIDDTDQMRLLEINSHPGFSYFIRDNGEEEVRSMYEKMLLALK